MASWSSIDYYGKWRALHYSAKKSFKTFLISHENTEDNIDLFVISDSLKNINAKLKVSLIDFEGNELQQWEEDITVETNNSNKYLSLSKKELGRKSKDVLLSVQLLLGDKVVADNNIYLSPFKKLDFPSPELTYSVKENNDSFEVIVKTKKLAKDVFISSASDENFSDNYFDMLPNAEKTVSISKNSLDLESFIESLKVVTLVDSYEK
ncbi:MAG: glycoside hydrolase family 2 protein [Fulvivirga sp.]